MKGHKDEEKLSNPMFPRLHVNDADIGGPRAPPRNKMALYEQLSIQSQRFNSSTLPPPLQNARSHRPSSSQGNAREGTMFSPFYVSPSSPAYSAEKANSRFCDGENMKRTNMEVERRSMRHVNFISANAVGSVAECSSPHQCDSSNAKNSWRKRAVVDDDDFRGPTFLNSENALYLNKDTPGIENKRVSPPLLANRSPRFNVQIASSCNRSLEQTGTSTDVKSGKHERKCNEQKHNDSLSLPDEVGEKVAEPSRFSKTSLDREHAGSRGICRELDEPISRNESQSNKVTPSHRSVDRISDDKENRTFEPDCLEDINNNEVSDTSVVDSISGLEISPDDVVGMIGPKQFWKARGAIVNQQRVFAVQVFELHRLMKVQKLLASSPHLLLDENSCIPPSHPHPQKVPIKNLLLESYAKQQKPQPPPIKQKDFDSEKPTNQNASIDYQMERRSTAVVGPPILSYINDVNKVAAPPPPVLAPPPSEDISPSNPPPPWCFPQPSHHQWLVPVMSPSEGLIYKPYSAGPCPPPPPPPPPHAGFMTPYGGNYGGIPAPPNYFPTTPYGGLPMMNQMISNSAAVKQMMSAPRLPPHNVEQNSQSSCNMSFPKSDAFTTAERLRRVHHASSREKDSELQGSTASSPSGIRVAAQVEGNNDALPLFPMEEQHQTRVIRVVPHNPWSASESAARIFRSIQEGRQQVDQ